MRQSLVALIFYAVPADAGSFDNLGTFTWAGEQVNGLSGIEVSDGGSDFLTISDQGWFVSGTFLREEDSTIAGIDVSSYLPILGSDGFPRAARRVGDWSDAEGLGVTTGGEAFVSFERWAHVAAFPDLTSTSRFIKDHPTFRDYQDNRQLEALAVDSADTVHVLPERPHPDFGGFPVYVLKSDGWDIVGTISELDGFSVVGADFGPDGTFYMLERKLVLGLWWQSRIRRFETPDGAGDILWTSRPGEFFNVEGIAVWPDDLGLRFTLVSDNNRDPSEPTQFIEFRLTE